MRISDWSSDVCSSDLDVQECLGTGDAHPHRSALRAAVHCRLVVDVALRHRHDLVRSGTPCVIGDEELAFDLDGHRVTPTYASNLAINSALAVSGTVHITHPPRRLHTRPVPQGPGRRP